MDDVYRTIDGTAEGLYREKGSRFIAFGLPVWSEEEAREFLGGLKKKYHDARHHCWAFRLTESDLSRFSDDGEPSGTAGKPIMNVLESSGLVNLIAVVVRYFGGTLLGRNRLGNAYRSATLDMISNARIIDKYIDEHYLFEFNYALMNEVMSVVKDESLPVTGPVYNEKCSFRTSIRKGLAKSVLAKLQVNEGFSYRILKEN